jgi:hypothetical protein
VDSLSLFSLDDRKAAATIKINGMNGDLKRVSPCDMRTKHKDPAIMMNNGKNAFLYCLRRISVYELIMARIRIAM